MVLLHLKSLGICDILYICYSDALTSEISWIDSEIMVEPNQEQGRVEIFRNLFIVEIALSWKLERHER